MRSGLISKSVAKKEKLHRVDRFEQVWFANEKMVYAPTGGGGGGGGAPQILNSQQCNVMRTNSLFWCFARSPSLSFIPLPIVGVNYSIFCFVFSMRKLQFYHLFFFLPKACFEISQIVTKKKQAVNSRSGRRQSLTKSRPDDHCVTYVQSNKESYVNEVFLSC